MWALEGLAEPLRALQGPSINTSAGKLLTTSAPTVEARTPPSVPTECKPVTWRPSQVWLWDLEPSLAQRTLDYFFHTWSYACSVYFLGQTMSFMKTQLLPC